MRALKVPLLIFILTAIAGAASGIVYVVFVQMPQQETLLQRHDREAAQVKKSFDSLLDEYRREGMIK